MSGNNNPFFNLAKMKKDQEDAARGLKVDGMAVEGIGNDMISQEIQSVPQAKEMIEDTTEDKGIQEALKEETDYIEITGDAISAFNKAKSKQPKPKNISFNYGQPQAPVDIMKEMRLRALQNLANRG